jgi:4-amino-4-deoxy-L-arabinose transferase-like glycosyltransferase
VHREPPVDAIVVRPAPIDRLDDPTSGRWLKGALLALLVLVWLGTLGQRSLIHSDEGRYASIALEMLRSGDWITPRLNGFLYFEKPVLQYWAGAASMALFGVNEFAARFWPGLSGLATVLMVGYTAGRLWGHRAGVRATAVAASTPWIILNSHFLTLDSGLSAFLTLALCALMLAMAANNPRSQGRWMLLCWAAMALATLSKGLVGLVIPGATLVIYSLWQRDFAIWRQLQWLRGMALFLLIAVPWFVAVSLRNPGFAEFFFIHEHFARYTSEVHKRGGGWWYFVPLLLVGLMPWTSALPWLLDPGNDPRRRMRALLIAWAAFVLLFFSLSGSKLPSYILPMFPTLALLVAERLERVSADTLQRHLWVPVAGTLLLVGFSFFAQRFASTHTPADAIEAVALAVRIGGGVFLVSAALAWWLLRRQRITAALLVVAMAQLVAMLLPMAAHDSFGQLKTAARISAEIRAALPPQAPIYAVQSYDQTLPFYLDRSVTLVDFVDEFAYGQQHEPERALATVEAFEKIWREQPQAAAYMELATYERLLENDLPMKLIYRDPRRVVVIRP